MIGGPSQPLLTRSCRPCQVVRQLQRSKLVSFGCDAPAVLSSLPGDRRRPRRSWRSCAVEVTPLAVANAQHDSIGGGEVLRFLEKTKIQRVDGATFGPAFDGLSTLLNHAKLPNRIRRAKRVSHPTVLMVGYGWG
eukprot:Skav203147  [mRNA]  locus=scaffold626:41271:42679:+ [translate_table: standard]